MHHRGRLTNPDGPGETDPGQEVTTEDGEDDATETASRGLDAIHQAPPLAPSKVMTEAADAGGEHDPHADADANAVSEEKLPVDLCDRGHEHAKHVERPAREDQVFEVPGVEERAGEAAEQRGEAELDGTDPGDLRRRVGRELVERIVALKHAKLALSTYVWRLDFFSVTHRVDHPICIRPSAGIRWTDLQHTEFIRNAWG